MKNLRQLLRRSGWLHSAKRRALQRQSPGSGKRQLSSEALEKRELLAGDFAWAHNYWHAADVDDNQQITVRDALQVINYISRNGVNQEVTEGTDADAYYDVNGDNSITVGDALVVINTLSRGEAADELVELELNARDESDNLIVADAAGDINVGVGDIFNLELSYRDLRSVFDATGAIAVLADFAVTVNDQPSDLLKPVLTETQFLSFDAAIRDSASGTVSFALETDLGTTTTPVTLTGLVGNAAATVSDALVELGYRADQFTVNRQTDAAGLAFTIRYTDTALDGTDLPNLVAIPNFDNVVVATTVDVAPIINEREKNLPENVNNPAVVLGAVNGKALVYNLNFESRTIDNDRLYSTLVFGTYDAANGLFDEVGGVAPTVPGGIPNITDDGSFPQPFDVLSIPVRITSPVTDLVVRLNPAEDREAVLLYDRDDTVTADLQLFDEDSVVTINAIGTLTGPTSSNGALPGTVEDAVAAVSVDLATLVTINSGGSATLAIETNGTLGTATISGGILSYIPSADAFGNDVIVYSATNADGTDNGTISVSVTAVNDKPIPTDDAATTDAGVAVIINVLGNDSKGPANESGQTLSVSSAGNGTNGSTSVGNDGQITYTPNAGFAGTDTFTYVVSDGIDNADTEGTVTVTVNASAGPTANDGTLSTTEDNASVVTIDLASLVTVTSGGVATFEITTDPTKGTAVLRGTLLDYTPSADEFGADSIVYRATNADGNDSGTIAVTISAVNDPVIAVADSATTAEDTAVTVTVLGNDSAGPANENQTLTVTQVSSVTNGAATINNDGTITFTPNTNFNGVGSFVYTVSDGLSSAQASVGITVNAVNDAPVAVADSDTTDEDNAVIIDVLTNDTDVDSNTTLSVSSASDGANGTTTVNLDGTITYTPAADFFGSDSFTYVVSDGILSDTATVSVTVNPINDAPVAVADSRTTTEGTPVTITVLTNDSPGPNETEAISVSSAGQGVNGSVVVNNDGTITYTPTGNTNGQDTFTYTITDGSLVSAAATVTVTVTEVNDPPVAVTDTASVDEDSSVAINVLTNDTDPENDTLSVSGVTQPSNGVVVVNSNGSVQYTPTTDFNGPDTFTYTVTDGNGASTTSVAVTVNPTNDAPVAGSDTGVTSGDSPVTITVLSNDSDIDGDTLSVASATDGAKGTTVVNANGTITYTPNVGTSGTDQFTYQLSDGTTTSTGTVSITDQLTAPTAGNGSLSTVEDATSAVTIDLSTIITADAGDAVVFTVSVNGGRGTASVNGMILSYTPSADEFGNDTVTYQAANSAGSDTGTIAVNISAVNDPPTANADSASTVKNQSVTIPVLSNDVDGATNEGDTLSVSSLGTASNGAVSLNADGTVTYAPDADFIGSDSFSYVLTDGTDTSTATVSVTVNDFQVSEISGRLFFDLIDNIDEFAASPGTVAPVRSGDYDDGESGLGGVEVRLVSGASENVTGLPVDRVVITKVDGEYIFDGVAPGTYKVIYDVPETIIFGTNSDGSAEAGTMEVVIGSAGGVTASGNSFALLGTRGAALGNIDILSSTYIARHGGSGADGGSGGEGGLVSLNGIGEQLFFMAQEGFDTIQFAELTLNEERDAALLSVIKADGSVETARLSEDDFVVNSDGTAVQFFGGYDDFNFVDADSNLVSSEFENYRNAIDKVLAGLV